jgi:hypothetical protein
MNGSLGVLRLLNAFGEWFTSPLGGVDRREARPYGRAGAAVDVARSRP